uniref:Protein phosphatase 1 regulatory subunit 21 n=1 Tax=Esox lucius TaxID=8010 RepID=A0A6Q2WX15_ESOLU
MFLSVCPLLIPKLRAQNQVLKKGVFDEQASSMSLKEQVKQREQSLRKVEQEMDSLTFRNQQLAKRVELLQEELAASEAKGKKTKVRGETDWLRSRIMQSQNVFDEDLRKKIQENEQLHIKFYEADEQHRQQEALLKARLEELEREREQHLAVVSSLTSKYMDTIERLQNDKARLEVRSQTLEREARDCRVRTEECQQQLRRCQSELDRQLKQSSSVIQEKLKARDVAGQALVFLQDLVAALLNFHSYTEQRVHIYPLDSSIEPISPLNQKFSQYLHENAAFVRPLEDGLVQLHQSITEDTVTVLETVGKLKDFAGHFTAYSHFLKKILPYQLKSLEEECGASLCTSSLTSKNQELQSDIKRITSVFDKINSYISLLALPSDTFSTSGLWICLNLIHLSGLNPSLLPVSVEMSKHYSQKASLEQELPTVTQKLRTTNECLLASLGSLTNSTGKIATFFSNNLDFFTSSTGYGPRGGAGGINPLQAESMLGNKKRACEYMQAIRKTRPESVPYTESLMNRRVLTSSTESREGLTQQVVASQEKIARLEQEKEHWLLEAQLGGVRLEKESQRIQELEAQLSSAQGGGSPALTSLEDGDVNEQGAGKEASLSIGMLTTTPTNEEVGDGDFREKLIKAHYMARVGELTTQLQISDSKAVNFHAECRALAKRLAIAEKSRETLAEEVKLANQNITRLQDELATTKRSYEDQLSMMSDHLCVMNETLSKQREEIDTLKLGSKVTSPLTQLSSIYTVAVGSHRGGFYLNEFI